LDIAQGENIMDRADAIRLTANIHPEFKVPDPEILRNTDPESQDKILNDPELWAASAQAEPVLEPNVEEVESSNVVVEPEVSEENPFSSWGISNELFNQYVESGVISDGKMQGRFSPSDLPAYISQVVNEQKLRGHLANEVGDLRQTVDEKNKEIEKVKEYNNQLLESNLTKGILSELEFKVKKGLREIDVDFDSQIPGLNDNQSQFFKDKIMEKAVSDRDVARLFKRANRKVPRSEDEWDTLRLEREDLFEKFVEMRDRIYEGELEKLYLEGAIDQNYTKIKENAFFDAAQVLYKNLIEDNISVPETDPRMESLILDGMKFLNVELAQAEREGRQPDSRYFYQHPVTGQPIPRAESLDLYLRLNRKDLLKQIPAWESGTPVKETTTDYREVYDGMVSSLQSALDNLGLEITPDDPLITEGVVHILHNKDNPLYWENGRPRKDALVIYQRIEKPTLISDVLEVARRDKMSQELANRTKSLQDEWASRITKANDTLPSIASSVAQSAPGQTIPLVSPDTYRNAKEMNRLASRMGITPMELYDQQKARILQLPLPQQQQYLIGI
jgi:hypothetical protein